MHYFSSRYQKAVAAGGTAAAASLGIETEAASAFKQAGGASVEPVPLPNEKITLAC